MTNIKQQGEEIADNTAVYAHLKALDPTASVFVAANAGAGKTSLLTNRVLSLLLHGVAPAKILCLTFTNAASAEMANRIQKELGKWVMADDEKLLSSLSALIGKDISTHMINRARSLFATVLESADGIRIQTIHGFCQSLLRRFPIEAGISPHFTVMDARTEQELLQEARLRLFNRAQTEDPRLQESLQRMAHILGESAFHSLVAELIKNKRQIQSLLARNSGVNDTIDAVYRILKVPMGGTKAELVAKHFNYEENTIVKWQSIIEILLHGNEAEQENAHILAEWFANRDGREKLSDDYANIFLTQQGKPRVTVFKKSTISDSKQLEIIIAEQERVVSFIDICRAQDIAENTAHILHFAKELLALYARLKSYHSLMDYDDLILTACDLLQKPGISPWVLFKLDGGIDHILVDEAQDTSPEQWTIINALTQEFFAGSGRIERDRSLFIVGDEKQSIYSFQGADPAALGRMRQHFTAAIKAAGKPLHNIELKHSFRSTSEVLNVVDSVFSKPKARDGLTFGNDELAHIATRLEHQGLVELWPLIEPQEGEEGIEISALTLLARRIAENIRQWIDGGIASPGDIMILVRSRTSLVDRMVRSLKKQGIPVAGHDRMALSENLAVQDLIALGQCLLLPEDDLSLAAVLKSSIFNLSEEQIFTLAYGRGKKRLWERLHDCSKENNSIKEALALMTDLRARADFVSPFELYSYLLDTLGARRRFIGRMGDEYNDPIDEFLGQTLLYERSHTSSLQGFLHWLNASDSEIKRDMEQAKDCVRIMTVHGAKGLQAPIVILPDTVERPTLRDTILWYDEKNNSIPLWSKSSDNDNSLCANIRYRQRELMYAEYRRLLYVALTRAENRLYICGATAKEKINEQCWYQLVKDGMESIATPFESVSGEGMRIGTMPSKSKVKKTGANKEKTIPEGTFNFLHKPPPDESVAAQSLLPSHIDLNEPAPASPLTSGIMYWRGTLIHRLLQYLPDIATKERMKAASAIAASFSKNMPTAEIDECISQTMAIIAHPKFSFIFSSDAIAEVPVAGRVTIDGKSLAVTGQIDRLSIKDDEVWIIDFKSNRLAPTGTQPIPDTYVRQMRLYYLLLKQIYPDKIVRCALLWTSVPSITILDESLLDETPIATYIQSKHIRS